MHGTWWPSLSHKDDTIKDGKLDQEDDSDDAGSRSRGQEHEGEALLDRGKASTV